MAGIITALQVQQRNQERVNVFVDGQFALGVTMLVAATLRKGQYLSDTDIEKLKQEDQRSKAYDKAIRFLGYRARSQTEVADYLRDKGYAPEVIEETVSRLVERQYLDDEAFARFWLENREQFRPRGRQALRYELKQKGISDEIIQTVLADVDEDELAWLAVAGKLQRWQNLPEPDLQKKVISFLSRRGFSYQTARQVFDRARSLLNIGE
ncbi:MAG: RecX family transcriptional regulator [Anaerolineae bacterium]|nr:RecX family transcriptional regulator [Anaerolineae bacterium]